jgi:tetratricopeptide (TPR) repeat protein
VLRDYGAAKTTFERVIKMLPGSSEVPLALGRIAQREGHWDQSVAYHEKALALAKVNPDLVARDGNGKPYTVRYEAVNAMLLNEFLKAHRKLEDQQQHIDALEAQLNEQKDAYSKGERAT